MFQVFKNKYLTKEQQLKRNFWKGFFICFIFLIIAIVFYQFFIIPIAQKAAVNKEMQSYKVEQVPQYVLNKNIKQGKAIDIYKDIKIANVNEGSVPGNTIRDLNKIKGMVARINLSEKTPITSDMFVNLNDYITQDLRTQDYSDIVLSKNLKVGDYVDIRYKKKDGTDFVVVAKKKVLNVAGLIFITNISEAERQLKNNATVNASLNGGNLYTTIYVDPENQEPAQVTYALNEDIQKMINSNSSLVKQAEQTLQDRNQAVNSDTFVDGGSR